MSLPLIGLTGRKRSGKDTAAAALVEHRGYRRLAFADALKAAALTANPNVYIGHEYGYRRLRDLVEAVGWETAKATPDVRLFLQDFGIGIRNVDADFWTRVVHREAETLLRAGFGVVVTDVRFLNEVGMIRGLGGAIWRIERPGLPDDGDTHVSEHEWRAVDPDLTVSNSGSAAALATAAIMAADRLADPAIP